MQKQGARHDYYLVQEHPNLQEQKGQQECTADWCQRLGPRYKMGISRMTFGRHCDRTCTPFECTRCGKTREQEEDEDGYINMRCLGNQLCHGCLGSDEWEQDTQQRIKTAMATGRIARGTRVLIDDIKDRMHEIKDLRIKARLLAAMAQIQRNEEEELRMLNWDYDHAEATETTWDKVTKFEVTGTIEKPENVDICLVCTIEDAEYAAENGRIPAACKTCAKLWTEETRSTKWKKFESKNDEAPGTAGNRK